MCFKHQPGSRPCLYYQGQEWNVQRMVLKRLCKAYAMQAHTRCQGVCPCTEVSSASHVAGSSRLIGFITWYQLFLAWCAQPPPSKACLPPKWEFALYPRELMMLWHVPTLLVASRIWSLGRSDAIDTMLQLITYDYNSTVHTAYNVIGFSVKSGIMSILGW